MAGFSSRYMATYGQLWGGKAECPLFVLELKIADAPTRLKYVSSDVNALNLQD